MLVNKLWCCTIQSALMAVHMFQSPGRTMVRSYAWRSPERYFKPRMSLLRVWDFAIVYLYPSCVFSAN